MRNKKVIFILITLLLIIFFTNLLTFKTATKDVLTEEFFYDDTNIVVERIIGSNFEEVKLPDNDKNDLIGILEKAKIKNTKETFSPLDAEFRISSTKNQVYLFVDKGVIVSPNKSINAYKIINNEHFMEEIEDILR